MCCNKTQITLSAYITLSKYVNGLKELSESLALSHPWPLEPSRKSRLYLSYPYLLGEWPPLSGDFGDHYVFS